MNKKFLLATVLLIAIVSASFFVGYVLIGDDSNSSNDIGDSTSSTSFTLNTSSPTNTAEATDGTEDWIEYVDPDYGFSFKYPKEWELEVKSFDEHKNVFIKTESLSVGISLNTTTEGDGTIGSSGMIFDQRFLDNSLDILIDGISAKINGFQTAIKTNPSELRVSFIEDESYPDGYVGSASYNYVKNGLEADFGYYIDSNGTEDGFNTIIKILETFKWPK